MKFLVSKDTKPSPLLKMLMAGVTLAILFYLLLDILLHGYLLGDTISNIQATLFGDESQFIEPILLETLLLQVHIDWFMTLFTVMILSSIYIRFYAMHKSTPYFVHLLLLTSLLSPLLLLLAFFTVEWLVLLWISCFFLWHGLALLMAILILGLFLR
ncbi:MAG: hypothetical protein Q9M36_03505 [Sulfurovum sp.]|nr:hypothetical protein [Sulfurovum sp.]